MDILQTVGQIAATNLARKSGIEPEELPMKIIFKDHVGREHEFDMAVDDIAEIEFRASTGAPYMAPIRIQPDARYDRLVVLAGKRQHLGIEVISERSVSLFTEPTLCVDDD